MAVHSGQRDHPVRVHQSGVRSDHRVLIADRHAGRYAAQVRVAAVLDRLLQQSVHRLSLDRHSTGFYRNDCVHRGGAERAQIDGLRSRRASGTYQEG